MKKIEIDEHFLYEEFIVKNKTIEQISKEVGLSHITISRNLKEKNIKKQSKSSKLNFEHIKKLYTDEKMSIREIAKIFNVAETIIRRLLEKNNVARRNRGWKSSNNKNGEIVKCEFCDKEIYRKKCKINKYKRFFCSWHCAKEYQSISKRKYDSENFRSLREYRKWSRYIKNRDGKCLICGETKNLHSHHIIEVQDDMNLAYDVNNGITLCKKCHILVHQHNSKKYIESLRKVICVENPNIGENLATDNPEAQRMMFFGL